jgi:hypothetical protein
MEFEGGIIQLDSSRDTEKKVYGSKRNNDEISGDRNPRLFLKYRNIFMN